MITRSQTAILTISAVIGLSAISYFFLTSKIQFIDVDDIVVSTDSGIAPLSDAEKDAKFNEQYPSAKDIETFLNNTTFTRTHNWGFLKTGVPNYDNSVYYFNSYHRFTYWRNYGGSHITPIDIEKGKWWTESVFYIIKYRKQIRFALGNRYCRWLPSYDRMRELNNCISVSYKST